MQRREVLDFMVEHDFLGMNEVIVEIAYIK
jgi:hypothetical protein